MNPIIQKINTIVWEWFMWEVTLMEDFTKMIKTETPKLHKANKWDGKGDKNDKYIIKSVYKILQNSISSEMN